jgi:hypothetical protein
MTAPDWFDRQRSTDLLQTWQFRRVCRRFKKGAKPVAVTGGIVAADAAGIGRALVLED